jgi:hypothetical protein
MSEKLKACLRALSAAGIALAAFNAAAQSAQPQTAAVESTDRVTVVRDATTGELRAPTQDEAAALKSSARKSLLRVAPPATLQKSHRSGATGVRLTDEFISSVVAVRQPDGSLSISEAHSADGATKAPVHATKTETE